MSAVATNHYTCYDGLVAANSEIGRAMAVAMGNVRELYSVSLGLVSQAMNHYMKKKWKSGKHGLLPSQSHTLVRQPLHKLIQVRSTSATLRHFSCVGGILLFHFQNLFKTIYFSKALTRVVSVGYGHPNNRQKFSEYIG